MRVCISTLEYLAPAQEKRVKFPSGPCFKMRKPLKCLFGFHKWTRLGGASNIGSGKFKIKLICEKCKKIKEVIK